MSVTKGLKKVVPLRRQAAKLVAVSESNIEMIRQRAYELFLATGATHGPDLADWLKAEQDLRTASQR
jgi:hypothetical protein